MNGGIAENRFRQPDGGRSRGARGGARARVSLRRMVPGGFPSGRRNHSDEVPRDALAGAGYRARTRKNVEDSDGTVLVAPRPLTGGTALTLSFCRRLGKPSVTIDAAAMREEEAAQALLRFVEAHRIAVLNVAGPRASGGPAGEGYARAAIGAVLSERASG
jgi:hypothetical protein